MKIGIATPDISNYEVRLPHEIIAAVALRIQAISSEAIRIRTLWSCCLLSRSWYSAIVPFLYESPRLTNKNFDKFARTICPPVNAHVRRVGLETFVRHLDMGHLAYESSKSLTARLLRRTRISLETFVAPAVSFSISSLAPLSKCTNLRSLDLSSDFYDMDLTQLLNAVNGLEYLTSLSLPRSAMRKKCDYKSASARETLWPQTLQFLQVNDWLPSDLRHWCEFITNLPPNLSSIAFEDCLNWNSFYQLDQAEAEAMSVRTLSIGMRRGEDGFPIEILFSVFPKITHLAIPTPIRASEFVTTSNSYHRKGHYLESLTFRLLPDYVQPTAILTTTVLSKCIEMYPTLTHIDVPESYLDVNDESMEDLDRMEKLLSSRNEGSTDGVGIFLSLA